MGVLCRVSANKTEWKGQKNAKGDPAILLDEFVWKKLSANLGTVTSARICAGLQVGSLRHI